MSKVLKELLDLLSLEQIEKGLFRGNSQELGFGHVFGGQVIGQALSAAQMTVDSNRRVHSFHSYFLLPGDSSKPIVYDVENIRDGRSISNRRVKAIQNGRSIFFMTASFHSKEQGFEHQSTMPDVQGPEGLRSELDIAREHAEKIPEKIRHKITCDKPIEIRPVNFNNPLAPKKAPPVRHVWLKANGDLPNDHRIHTYLLAYASDFGFLTTATQPHAVSIMTPNFQVATIDHAMWFHRDFQFDEWLLYVNESPSASNQRGFVTGKIFNQKGELVASSTQEGIIRFKK